jgi:hypothetical protein
VSEAPGLPETLSGLVERVLLTVQTFSAESIACTVAIGPDLEDAFCSWLCQQIRYPYIAENPLGYPTLPFHVGDVRWERGLDLKGRSFCISVGLK